MTSALRTWLVVPVLGALTACSGPVGQPTATLRTPSPAPSALASVPGATARQCTVTVDPPVAAPGGWSVVVGSGFAPGENVTWSQHAEDGTLGADWDTASYEPMLPDARGGFGFGLGSPGADAIGHTISATITSASCTAHASWRVEATNDQTGPLPSTPAASCATNRTSVERVDDSADHQVHLLYALPSDAVDLELDRHGLIGTSLDHIQQYLRERLDGSAFRLDTCDGDLDVTFLRLPRPSVEFAAMRNAFVQGLELYLAKAGFRHGKKLYVVVWGGHANWARVDDGCGGDAGYQGVAVLYLRTVDGAVCPAPGVELPIGEPDTGLAHEIIHLLGLPAGCGANVDEGGHVTDDPADLMYGRGHTTAEAIDAGHDDYYRHGIAGCPDLANSAFLDPLPARPELPAGWPGD